MPAALARRCAAARYSGKPSNRLLLFCWEDNTLSGFLNGPGCPDLITVFLRCRLAGKAEVRGKLGMNGVQRVALFYLLAELAMQVDTGARVHGRA